MNVTRQLSQSAMGRAPERRQYNKQGILSLTIKDRALLYEASVPVGRLGGLVVLTNRKYELGEEVFILLALMDEPRKSRSTEKWYGLLQKVRRVIGRLG